MAQVVVRVNDRPYTMECGHGEEEHLLELAQLLDSEVSKLKRSVGQVGDIRLLLMAGITIADKLSEALRHIEALQDEVAGLKDARMAAIERSRAQEDRMAEQLSNAAAKLETLSREHSVSED
ncbi:cell division protein ZapA [Rhodoligotrophos appendicifer]|uniref:cell division protein ZapA n=1 Tax=Rhodoligotrophos appendicifer TaxID=987056 RepID=UPI0011863114|nr:cell division protein ZapA [Rhodoligotrophos appendicifer]